MENRPGSEFPATPEPVVAWLLGSDPALRWQVMHNLLGAPDQEIVRSGPAWPPRAGARACCTPSSPMASGQGRPAIMDGTPPCMFCGYCISWELTL